MLSEASSVGKGELACPRCGGVSDELLGEARCEVCARLMVPRSSLESGDGDPILGEVLLSRFVALGLRAWGASASVYDAFDLESKSAVVVKVRRVETDEDAELEREASILQGVALDAVPRVLAVGRQNLPPSVDAALPSTNVAVLAMGAVRGRALSEVHGEGGVILLRPLLSTALALLDELHRCGVAHGDLKPAHVFVDAEGRVVGVVDFGCATTRTERVARGCTPAFSLPMPPDGTDRDRFARDLFALGALVRRIAGAEPIEDRAVERALERCTDLSAEPSTRATSRVLQILADSA